MQRTIFLLRVAGQVEGIARIVEDDRYCVSVLLQAGSAEAALGQAAKLVLRSHVDTCVAAAMSTGRPSDRKQKLDELVEAFARYGCLGSK